MKYFKILILPAFAALMLYASIDLPKRGDPDTIMNRDSSMTGTEVAGSYYVQQAYHDAKTPNMVTVVLGDYRSTDTIGEQVVIFTAGIITMLLLRKHKKA